MSNASILPTRTAAFYRQPLTMHADADLVHSCLLSERKRFPSRISSDIADIEHAYCNGLGIDSSGGSLKDCSQYILLRVKSNLRVIRTLQAALLSGSLCATSSWLSQRSILYSRCSAVNIHIPELFTRFACSSTHIFSPLMHVIVDVEGPANSRCWSSCSTQ